MNNITMQKKLEALINYIQGLSLYSLPHAEGCNFTHPMSMSNTCTCHCDFWLDLKKEFEAIDDEQTFFLV